MRGRIPCLLALAASAACVRHIYPYEPKVRDYQPATYADQDAHRTQGSLWSEGAHGLFEDARARRVGDILTVRIQERSDATRDASTKTSRSSSTSIGASALFGAMQTLVANNPDLDPEQLIAALSESEFEGEGATTRSGALTAILPVHIRAVLDNGDFYVEGHKVLLLNEEESHLYISGVVRPIDIQPDNSVASSVLADVEVEYTGRGVVTERQSPGWGSRLLDAIWPF